LRQKIQLNNSVINRRNADIRNKEDDMEVGMETSRPTEEESASPGVVGGARSDTIEKPQTEKKRDAKEEIPSETLETDHESSESKQSHTGTDTKDATPDMEQKK